MTRTRRVWRTGLLGGLLSVLVLGWGAVDAAQNSYHNSKTANNVWDSIGTQSYRNQALVDTSIGGIPPVYVSNGYFTVTGNPGAVQSYAKAAYVSKCKWASNHSVVKDRKLLLKCWYFN